MSIAQPTTQKDAKPSARIRQHTTRGYYLKRNGILLLLVFLWIAALTDIYPIDVAAVSALCLGTVLTYALLKNQFRRFTNKRHYFFAVATVDNIAITLAIFVMGGTGSAAVFTFYLFPIIYHSLSRSRAMIYGIANSAALMCTTLYVLEWAKLIPQYNLFGFGRPHDSAYPGLILGAILMLNLAAFACDRVARLFIRVEQELEQLENQKGA